MSLVNDDSSNIALNRCPKFQDEIIDEEVTVVVFRFPGLVPLVMTKCVHMLFIFSRNFLGDWM